MEERKFTIRNTVPMSEMERYMRRWEERAHGFVKVYSIGESGGWPIWCAEFTDPEVPEEEKEVAMVMAQHSMELSGVTTVLSTGNYLAALDERARQILAHQIVLVIPCSNCYSYEKMDPAYQFKNAAGLDEYAGAFSDDLTVDEEKTPVAAALKALVDKWQPEFIFDAHGVWFNEAIGLEFTGTMSFSGLNRTFERSFVDEIHRSTEMKGFAIKSEDDLQTLFPTDPICHLPKYRRKFRGGAPRILLGSYAYIKYHTLFLNMEVAFEGSGLERIVRALELGNNGYPVRTMFAPLGLNSVLTGEGNASERRKSRVELWNQNHCIGGGAVYPETCGMSGLVITCNREIHKQVLGENETQQMNEFLKQMEERGYGMDEIRQQLSGELPVYIYNWAPGTGTEKVVTQHGMTLRLGLPFADARPTGVWLNGKQLSDEEYRILRGRNWTNVDVIVSANDQLEVMFAFVKYDYTPKKVGILEF